MGADLISWILIGPEKVKLSPGKRKNLLNSCKEIVFAAKMSASGRTLSKKQEKLLEPLDDEYNVEYAADLEPVKVLDAFLDLWTRAGYRDTSTRAVTLHGEDYQILVAGDTTWGDEPEGGGYQTIKNAGMLGIPYKLGIR
jgi:hypothetical protein